jgi:hypothetical protein
MVAQIKIFLRIHLNIFLAEMHFLGISESFFLQARWIMSRAPLSEQLLVS